MPCASCSYSASDASTVFFTPVKAVSQSAAALTPATPRAVAAAETGARALPTLVTEAPAVFNFSPAAAID